MISELLRENQEICKITPPPPTLGLKQDKVTFTHKEVVSIYINCKINLWLIQGTDFTVFDTGIQGADITL